MTTAQPTIFDRLNALPRAARWALYAAVAMLGFFAWDGTIQPIAAGWNEQSAAIEAKVAKLRAGDKLGEQYTKLTSLVESIGPVEVPGDEQSGRNALNTAINEVLAKHPVSKASFASGPSGRMPKNSPLTKLEKLKARYAEVRIDIVSVDLQFDASPKDAIAVLAALEAHPDIDAVKSVRIGKETNQKVKVRLILEAWVVSNNRDNT